MKQYSLIAVVLTLSVSTFAQPTFQDISFNLPVLNDMYSISISSTDEIYVGGITYGGVNYWPETGAIYKYDAVNQQWLSVNTPSSAARIGSLELLDQTIFCFDQNSVYKSSDGGITWNQANNGLPAIYGGKLSKDGTGNLILWSTPTSSYNITNYYQWDVTTATWMPLLTSVPKYIQLQFTDNYVFKVENPGYSNPSSIEYSTSPTGVFTSINTGLPPDYLTFKIFETSNNQIYMSVLSSTGSDIYQLDLNTNSWSIAQPFNGVSNIGPILDFETINGEYMILTDSVALQRNGTVLSTSQTVSVSEQAISNIKVYPTVTTDMVSIHMGTLDMHEVRILNQSGQVLKVVSDNSTEMHISLADLPPGTYYVHCVLENKSSVTERIILL